MSRERALMIERAKEYEADYHANPQDNRFYSDMIADFATSEVELAVNDYRRVLGELVEAVQGELDCNDNASWRALLQATEAARKLLDEPAKVEDDHII